jgi:hypothetical protein
MKTKLGICFLLMIVLAASPVRSSQENQTPQNKTAGNQITKQSEKKGSLPETSMPKPSGKNKKIIIPGKDLS